MRNERSILPTTTTTINNVDTSYKRNALIGNPSNTKNIVWTPLYLVSIIVVAILIVLVQTIEQQQQLSRIDDSVLDGGDNEEPVLIIHPLIAGRLNNVQYSYQV